MNRLLVAISIFTLLLLAVAAGKSEAVPDSIPARVPVQPSIEVVFLEGEVLIDGKEPELGDKLGTSFVVQTGRGARCDIVFNSGSALSVGQNALADFDFSSQVANVRVERGGLSSVLKKLAQISGSDAFTVQTATAVAGVRGTSFCVWVDESSSYICACNGVLNVADATGGNAERIEAAHHSARYFSNIGDAINKETAGMRHHTDELLQSVASRIAYTIDWTTIDG